MSNLHCSPSQSEWTCANRKSALSCNKKKDLFLVASFCESARVQVHIRWWCTLQLKLVMVSGLLHILFNTSDTFGELTWKLNLIENPHYLKLNWKSPLNGQSCIYWPAAIFISYTVTYIYYDVLSSVSYEDFPCKIACNSFI